MEGFILKPLPHERFCHNFYKCTSKTFIFILFNVFFGRVGGEGNQSPTSVFGMDSQAPSFAVSPSSTTKINSKGYIQVIEKVQRRASRLALNQRRGEMSYEDRCKLLDCPTLSIRRDYLSLI